MTEPTTTIVVDTELAKRFAEALVAQRRVTGVLSDLLENDADLPDIFGWQEPMLEAVVTGLEKAGARFDD